MKTKENAVWRVTTILCVIGMAGLLVACSPEPMDPVMPLPEEQGHDEYDAAPPASQPWSVPGEDAEVQESDEQEAPAMPMIEGHDEHEHHEQ